MVRSNGEQTDGDPVEGDRLGGLSPRARDREGGRSVSLKALERTRQEDRQSHGSEDGPEAQSSDETLVGLSKAEIAMKGSGKGPLATTPSSERIGEA